MGRSRRSPLCIALVAVVALAGVTLVAPAGDAATNTADTNLQRALDAIVQRDDGPPGIVAVVQRGSDGPVLHTAGVADVTTKAPITATDAMRMASVAKAFSGAAAVSAVADG